MAPSRVTPFPLPIPSTDRSKLQEEMPLFVPRLIKRFKHQFLHSSPSPAADRQETSSLLHALKEIIRSSWSLPLGGSWHKRQFRPVKLETPSPLHAPHASMTCATLRVNISLTSCGEDILSPAHSTRRHALCFLLISYSFVAIGALVGIVWGKKASSVVIAAAVSRRVARLQWSRTRNFQKSRKYPDSDAGVCARQ